MRTGKCDESKCAHYCAMKSGGREIMDEHWTGLWVAPTRPLQTWPVAKEQTRWRHSPSVWRPLSSPASLVNKARTLRVALFLPFIVKSQPGEVPHTESPPDSTSIVASLTFPNLIWIPVCTRKTHCSAEPTAFRKPMPRPGDLRTHLYGVTSATGRPCESATRSPGRLIEDVTMTGAR